MSTPFNTIPTITELATSQEVVTTLLHPDLILAAKDFIIESPSVVKVSFPRLQVIDGSVVNKSPLLEQIELPEMVEGGYRDQEDSRVKVLSLDKVKILREFNLLEKKTDLIKISLQSVEHCAEIKLPLESPNLRTFTFGPNLKQYGSTHKEDFKTTSNCLNQESVNSILMSFAALDGTKGTVEFCNRIIIITGQAATPGVRGLAAIKVLQKRGCTIITNHGK